MKLFFPLLLMMAFYVSKPLACCGQRAGDSILVEGFVHFRVDSSNIYRYDENSPYVHDIIEFELKVTNKTRHSIPDLNYLNREKYVIFYVNGSKENKLLHVIDESFSPHKKDWVIKPGESDTFNEGWYFALDEKYGVINAYGTSFFVQWEYKGI